MSQDVLLYPLFGSFNRRKLTMRLYIRSRSVFYDPDRPDKREVPGGEGVNGVHICYTFHTRGRCFRHTGGAEAIAPAPGINTVAHLGK